MPNVHMPATAVATFANDRVTRLGKVHRIRSGKTPAGVGRNRRQYRVACGIGQVNAALPARVVPPADVCRHCWPTLPGQDPS